MQRGFLTYFVEDREVFTEAYGRSLQVLARRDEQDALQAEQSLPPDQPAQQPVPHAGLEHRMEEAATAGSRGSE
jgi:hypothetical protein